MRSDIPKLSLCMVGTLMSLCSALFAILNMVFLVKAGQEIKVLKTSIIVFKKPYKQWK